MYARNGRILFDTTPGGHRRFDIDEVRDALDVRRRMVALRAGLGDRGAGSRTLLSSTRGLAG